MTLSDYELVAIKYCEQYGIIEYQVKDNLLTYYQNYNDDRDANGNRLAYTMKRVINLDTMKLIQNVRLKKLNKIGWHNVQLRGVVYVNVECIFIFVNVYKCLE